MKKTSKTLFSLLLVLTMVFQFAAVAPMAWADLDGSKEVSLKLFVKDGDEASEVTDPDQIGSLIDAQAFPLSVSKLREDGLELSPASGYAVIDLYIAPAAKEDPSSDLFDNRHVSEEEGKNAVIVIDADMFADDAVFNDDGSAESYFLFVTLGKVTSQDGVVFVVDGKSFKDPACTTPVDSADDGDKTDDDTDGGKTDGDKDDDKTDGEGSDGDSKLTPVAEVPATCETAGMKAHYKDADGNLFADEAGETPTTEDELKIAALGHDWGAPTYEWDDEESIECTATRVCTRDASHKETEAGKVTGEVTAMQTCIKEGAITRTATFENPAFSTQTKVITTPVIDSHHGFDLVHHEAVAATAEKDGNIEYWECADCGKYFSDATGDNEITDKASVVVKWTENAPAIIKDGTDTEWKQDSKDGLKIHIDATFDETLKDTLIVKIGDTVVPKDKYTVTSGSVIVTIDPAYLATLPAGTHTINITFPSGNTVESTVTIAAAAPGVTAMAFAIDEAGFTKVYDGKTFDLDSLFDYVTLTNLPDNYTAEVEIAFEDASLTEFHNVGSTTVKLSLKSVKDASNNDVTSQFSCEDKTGVKLTITKRKITVETRDDSKVYDGKAWTYTHMSNAQPIMTYTDAKLGEYTRGGTTYTQTISIKYTASPKNMGTYDNTAQLIIREKVKGSSETGTDVSDNYEITYKFGKIKITDSKGNVPANSAPATGDANNIWLWVCLMAAAVILVVVILLAARKSRKGDKAPSSGAAE